MKLTYHFFILLFKFVISGRDVQLLPMRRKLTRSHEGTMNEILFHAALKSHLTLEEPKANIK